LFWWLLSLHLQNLNSNLRFAGDHLRQLLHEPGHPDAAVDTDAKNDAGNGKLDGKRLQRRRRQHEKFSGAIRVEKSGQSGRSPLF